MYSVTGHGLIKRKFIVGGGGCFKPGTDKMGQLPLHVCV